MPGLDLAELVNRKVQSELAAMNGRLEERAPAVAGGAGLFTPEAHDPRTSRCRVALNRARAAA